MHRPVSRTFGAAIVGGVTVLTGCATQRERTFGEDAAFLARHSRTVEIASADGHARIVVAPQYQGRVMTSTLGGPNGLSYGYLNDDLIKSGKPVPKISVWGGEDRFWLGPEGGQFAIFFKQGDEFTLKDWQTPAPIDSVAYEVVSQTPDSVTLKHDCTLTNYSGTTFNVRIDRTIRIVERESVAGDLGINLAGCDVVAFESENTITNIGTAPWRRETGLLSIWILGMFKPSDTCTVVIPYKPGPDESHGPVVKDDYFGKVPEDRLTLSDEAIFFRGDSRMRTKIGVGPGRALPVCGSWDPERGVLTLVTYTLPPGVNLSSEYINSMWEHQQNPYAGDVINSYNDAPGKHGPTFYELETSSPALALAPGQSATHMHRTIHVSGDRSQLDAIARRVLKANLSEIENALP